MRYGNAVIRQLLRRLRRPAELEALPLGKALRRATGLPTAFEATRSALRAAFDRCGPAGERYWRLIWSYDVERTINRERAAEELAVSPRQFFRLRAEAVQAFSSYVSELLAGPSAAPDPIGDAAKAMLELDPVAASELLALCREPDLADRVDALFRIAVQSQDVAALDPEVLEGPHKARALLVRSYIADLRGDHDLAAGIRAGVAADGDRRIEYERASIEFSAARYSGIAGDLLAKAREIERIGAALGGEYAIAPLLPVAEAAILNGHAARAREAIDLAFYAARENRHYRMLGYALLRRAQLDMLEGRFDEALRYARGATIALRAFPDGLAAADETLGRISTLLGIPWRPRPFEDGFEGSRWLAIAANGMSLRNAMASAALPLDAIESAARANGEEAAARGYFGLSAFSLATAALAGTAIGSPRANGLALRAWDALVRSGNHLLATDAFVVPGRVERDFGPIAFDGETALAFARPLAAVPGMGSLGVPAAVEPLARAWPTILAVASGRLSSTVPMEYAQGLARALVGAGVTAGSFERVSSAALRDLTTWTRALIDPDERPAFERRLLRTLRTFQYHVERSVAQERYRIASHASAC